MGDRIAAGVLGLALCACSSTTTGLIGAGDRGTGGTDAGTSSGGTASVCGRGDTRECAGPGACKGAQTCLADGSGYGACDCGSAQGGGGGGATGAGGAGGTPVANGGTAGGGTAGSGGGFIVVGGGGSGGGPQGCTGTILTPELLPEDLYVMFDQSSSMGDPLPGTSSTWWAAAQTGLTGFVQSPKAAGLGVGIQYFPLNGVAPASCTADYATPEVEIGVLPGNAASLLASIQKHQPTAFTPTAPALSGALSHMKAWGAAHPDRSPAVVLVTDGFPTECQPQQLADIAAIAKTGLATDPKVRTFVIGLNLGSSGQSFQEISIAGGTSTPFLIDGGDVPGQLTSALLAAGTGQIPCELPLPTAGPKVDPSLVNVQLVGTKGAITVPGVTSAANCSAPGAGGWYYDDPVSPTRAILCPSTCSGLGTVTARLMIGCATVVSSGG